MEIVNLKGIIKKKLPDQVGTTNGKKWVRRTFILKPLDGGADKFISTFSKFDNTMIGKVVEFDADYNAQYNSYVTKEVKEIVQADVAEPTQPEVTEGTSEGTAPTNVTATVDQKPARKQSAPKLGLEDVRADAEKTMAKNIQFAEAYLGKDASKDAVATIAVGLQQVMATIYINQEKDRRMKEFK